MRVLVSNPYVFNKRGAALARWLDDRGFDVALLSEMRLLHDDVRHLGHLASGKHGEMRNNVVLTRKPHRGKRVVKLCEGVGDSKVWKDRLYVRVVQDGVAYYALHANAVIQKDGRWRDNEGARRWRKAMVTLLKAMQEDLDAGLELVFGGDMNWRHGRRVYYGSPEWLCRELGLRFVATEVMWLAWSPGLRLDHWRRFHTPPGADGHPVIVADLAHRAEPENTVRVRDVQQSGHATATDGQWNRMMGDLTRYATVAGVTESRGVEPPEGWSIHRGDHETEIFWDEEVWDVEDQGVLHLSTPEWKRGRSTRTSVPVTWVLLVHRWTGMRYLRFAGHLPAHHYLPRQRRAFAAALAGLGDAVTVLRNLLKPDEITGSFDFNLDLSRAKNRRRIEAAVTGTGLDLVVPPKPTFRRRTIDGHLTTMRVTSRTMLPRYAGMDHRGSRAVLAPSKPRSVEGEENSEEDDVPHGFMPGAIHKPIPAGSNDPSIDPVGVIYHVAVSLADSLHDFFAHRSGGIESHFYVRLDGTIEQYRSIFREADANYRANSFGSPRRGFISVETEGMGAGEWTEAQIRSLKRITVWCAEQGNFPIRKAPGPYSPGVGYHTMFGAPSDWTPVSKSCPGPARIRQFNTIFVPWFRRGAPTDEKDWFDMASKKDLREVVQAVVREEVDKILEADMNLHEPKGTTRFRGMTLRQLLKDLHRAVVNKPTE